MVPIDAIDLDSSNPRIAHFLEHQDPPYSDEMLHLALETDGDVDGGVGTTFLKLKESILANGGIIQPILLQKIEGGRYLCVEGNTRVFLYRDFRQKNVPGNWETIPSLVHANISEADVHAIRLQAHLVGPRRWEPYARAKYLFTLRNDEKLPIDTLIQFCGGNSKSIRESLAAYEDMEKFYRPLVGDENFDTSRFSGFLELQKPGVKEALIRAGCTVADFAEWIDSGKIGKLQNVRVLPLILKDERAKRTFLESDVDTAVKMLDRPQLNKALEEADISSLARALRQGIDAISFKEFMSLKENPSSSSVQYLREALESLQELLKQIESE